MPRRRATDGAQRQAIDAVEGPVLGRTSVDSWRELATGASLPISGRVSGTSMAFIASSAKAHGPPVFVELTEQRYGQRRVLANPQRSLGAKPPCRLYEA